MEQSFNYVSLINNLQTISEYLKELLETPGPTRCIAKLRDDFDPRLSRTENYFMFSKIKDIVDEFNKNLKKKIFLKQHNGNIIVIGGFKKKPSYKKIKKIPVTLTSHADEITFLVTKKKDKDNPTYQEVLPICQIAPIINKGYFLHSNVEVYGFREEGDKVKFKKIRRAKIILKFGVVIKNEENEEVKKEENTKKKNAKFYIDLGNIDPTIKETPVMEGDLVIQDYYLTKNNETWDDNTIFHSKALDDRVGVLSHLYTIYYLSKYSEIKSKAIFSGDEEGIPVDISWARLARPTFKKYCRKDGIIIVCDGMEGMNIDEFPRFKHIEDALIVPYTSDGKGGGDPGLFSYLRDVILKKAEENDFSGITCTDYASRSLDPKIMDEFALICFINWSNGPARGGAEIRFPERIIEQLSEVEKKLKPYCHLDEYVKIKQVLNIIGSTFYAVEEFSSLYKNH